MNCPYCNKSLPEGLNFCTECGRQLPSVSAPKLSSEQAPFQQNFLSETPANLVSPVVNDINSTVNPSVNISSLSGEQSVRKPSSFKEYIDSFADEKTRKNVLSDCYVLYFLAGVNFLYSLWMRGNILSLDAIFLLIMGIWYQKTYSTVCAIIFGIYAALSFILKLFITEGAHGWLYLVIGVSLVYRHFKAKKEYDKLVTKRKLYVSGP